MATLILLTAKQGELDLEDDNELNAQTQTRAKSKKAKDQEGETPVKVLLGRKEFELFLKCIQLILRKQVWVFVYERAFQRSLRSVIVFFHLAASSITEISLLDSSP